MANRIDKELFIRNLAPSRAKAQELIKANLVLCNGKIVEKMNYLVSAEDKINIKENDKLKYVSRGGLKLQYRYDRTKNNGHWIKYWWIL